MASVDLEYNSGFQIYNSDGTPFHDLVLHKCTYETVVMSLGDKISGILYYKDNALDVTMSEYIIYKGVRYTLVNPPTILREGLVSDNSELRGMTKYSFTFYHPMYVLNNFPFSDVAVQSGQSRYLSQNKTFSWIGTLVDFVAKLNKNLEGTQWMVTIGNVTQEEQTKLSEVLSFDKNTIAEALKRGYETWEVPYVVDQLTTSSPYYPEKRFVVQFGLPTTEILDEYNQPFVFQMGQGVGLKNNSRNPKNNKIITRIAGYGSEDNIPYGYPQIPYYGGNVEYPLYYGIVGGQRVQLIKHPFTRNHLMPSVYSQSVYNKVNPKLPNGNNNPNYNPNIELVDYYDANDNTYTNRIKPNSPSYEIHEFGDIKPELGEKSIISAVPVSQQETQPDYKQKSDFLQEILDRISATEIEDEKTELLDVYDRVDAGLSYYEKHGEEGGDTYWFVFSITRDDYYEYVSYESSNYNFTATVLRNGSSAPTPDWDDTMDDDGNYLQSYFKITLPILEFDLYACAAITQEMKINMRSGACIGCTFPVEVDWDDYKRNFYNSDGEFAPDGEQRDYTKYPDSSSGQITVMVKKELETFGTLMPNQYQQPTTGDKFVILGISLPNTYITSAEQRLDTDMKQYMRDNNVYYYDYPLKFDEHFLISHEDILSQMKNNVVVRFNYAGTEHALYIKQMSVKYNESPLPKYDITLTDDIEIVLNQIGQVTDEVSKLRLGFGAGGFGTVGAEYIRKDIDDTARGNIRMIKGMQVGERFVTGLLGEGGVFRKDSDGTTYLETDKLYVRMKAYFDTVEVKHYLHTGGNRIASQASGIVCSRVEMIDAYGGLAMDVADAVFFRCFFKANDGDKTIRNDFMIGDLAFCRETNVDVSSVNLHGYWRLVIGRNVDGFLTENKEAWIDLSNRASDTITVGGRQYSCAGYQNGSDAPIAQDDIIQLGNIVDKDRQGAIVEYVGGEDAPSYQIFQGIGEDLPYPYTLEDKNYIGLGYSSQTGHAYMNVYGDVFIGAKPDAVTGESPTYIKYVQEDPETGEPKLTIKAVVEFQSPDDPQTTTTLDDFARLITGDIENIQSQIDGEIDTWFYAGIPTLQNAPANEWTTDAEKEKHTGDLYYDIGTGADAGKAYRFIRSQTTPYVYLWQYIDDTAITEALRIAAHAQDTADHKRRVFVTQPLPPYDIGDLWSDAVYPSGNTEKDSENGKYYKDLLTCKVAKEEGESFSISDWGLTTNYTDDSALLDFLDGYQGTLTTIRNQVDAKAETWYQDEDPSTLTPQQGGWYGGDDAEHVGDIWFCTKNHASPSLFKKGTTWIWQPHTTEHGVSYSWEEQEIPDEVFDKIDGKSSIYANDPNDVDSTKRHPSNYKANDVWILPMIYVNGVLNPSTYTINNIVYGAGEMLTALRDNETYSAGDWAKKVRYTDDSALNDFKTNQYVQLLTGGQITSDINSARQTADNAQTAAEAAQTSADNANTKLTNWASDSYISPTEKTALKTEWEDVKTEYTQICNDADKYSIDKTAFTSAYTSANAAFQKYTAATPENITVGSDYQNIKNYYSARQTILNAISDAAKTLAQNAATAYMSDTAINAIKYALNGGSTTQDGGLILSNIIALRDANQNVMSGMNGVYNSQLTSGGIAAWYGGAMTDHEQSPSALNYAKSLFRFDGSGYLAGGNITWDAQGRVAISDITTLIGNDDTDVLNALTTFNSAFHFNTQQGTGTILSIAPQMPFASLHILENGVANNVATQKWVSDNYISIAFFNRLFQAYSSTTISDANKVAANDTTTAINNLKLLVGTWTNEYLSALGLNSSGSGGGIGDVTWTQLTANNSSTGQQIHASHLSSVTQPLYFLFNEDSNPTVTYDGKTNKAVGNILTKTYADGRYYKKIANGSASEVVLADGTSSKLNTINGNSIFGDGDIVISSSAYPSGTAELLAAGTDTTDRVWSAKILSENVGGRQYYGTCSSAAAAQAKVATIPANQNFRLAVGAIITIKFSNTNTFSATASDLITLNVNGTGAKQIWYNTSAANTGTNTACYGYKNRYITYIYDGTYWVWVSRGMDTTYSQGTADLLTAGTSTTSMIWQPKILRDEFDKYLPLNGGTMTGSIIMGTNHYIRFFEGNNSWYIQAYDGRFSVGPNGSELSFDTSGNILARTFITTEKGALIGCDLNTPLRINCTKDNEDTVFLEFQMKSLSCGYYCAGTDKKPYFWDTSKKKIWYEGNDGASSGLDADLLDGQHGSYYATAASLGNYLPISGGTLIGNNATVLAVRNTSSATNNYIVIRCTNNGTSVDAAYFGHWGDGWGAFMQNPMATGVPIMGIDDNGTPYFSVSGIENKKTLFHTGNLTSLSQLTNDLTYVLDSVDSSHHITFSYRGAGLNDSDWFAAWNNTQLRAIGKSTVKSILGVSTIEGYFTNGEANRSRYLATWLNDMSGTYGDSYKFYVKWDTGSTLRLYCSNNNVDFDVRATAADKLVTGRTLWGQTFDGTGNVTGTISGTANIYPSATSSYDIGNSSLNYKYLWVNWIGSSNGSLEFGGANAYHMAILANGNVGIGTRSPSTKLHVEGNAKIGSSNGNFIEIGAVRLVYDSSNNAIKVVANDGTSAANFYATGAVSALGANSESGGGVGDVTWSALESSSDTRQIAASHLSSVTQPLYFLFNEESSPSITYNGRVNRAVSGILTKSYADGRYVKQSGNATISGTATIGGYMTIGATVAVGTVNSQVIQTLNSCAIYIKTGSAPNYVDGTWSNTSDIRLKDIINNVGASVDQIANAPIFNYKWKSGGVSIMLGSSAQYWQKVFQHAVEIGPENYLYMDYSSVALASAVMVARKVQNHEDRILKLERENENLRNRIKQLEAA